MYRAKEFASTGRIVLLSEMINSETVMLKTVEFESTVGPEGQIVVPPDLARKLPSGEPMHITLQWGETGYQDAAWRLAGRKFFEGAYDPEDAVYEQLIDATPAR